MLKRSVKKAVKRQPTPRLLLSGDAAKCAAIALFVEGELVGRLPADGSTFRTLQQAVRALVVPFSHIPANERAGIIEEGFISFHSVKGSLTLGRRRGLMQAAFEDAGVDSITYIPAATWQAWAFNHHKVPDTKAASIALAVATYGVESTITDDEADAINMAGYFLAERTCASNYV